MRDRRNQTNHASGFVLPLGHLLGTSYGIHTGSTPPWRFWDTVQQIQQAHRFVNTSDASNSVAKSSHASLIVGVEEGTDAAKLARGFVAESRGLHVTDAKGCHARISSNTGFGSQKRLMFSIALDCSVEWMVSASGRLCFGVNGLSRERFPVDATCAPSLLPCAWMALRGGHRHLGGQELSKPSSPLFDARQSTEDNSGGIQVWEPF